MHGLTNKFCFLDLHTNTQIKQKYIKTIKQICAEWSCFGKHKYTHFLGSQSKYINMDTHKANKNIHICRKKMYGFWLVIQLHAWLDNLPLPLIYFCPFLLSFWQISVINIFIFDFRFQIVVQYAVWVDLKWHFQSRWTSFIISICLFCTFPFLFTQSQIWTNIFG